MLQTTVGVVAAVSEAWRLQIHSSRPGVSVITVRLLLHHSALMDSQLSYAGRHYEPKLACFVVY